MIHVKKNLKKKKVNDSLNTDVGNKSSVAHHCEILPESKEQKRRDLEAF